MIDPNGIYYLGPKGSFTNEVAEIFEGDKIPKRTITEVFNSITDNSIGIVPIENSIEGPVHETLDNLFKNEEIYVNYEIEKEIKLVLAVNPSVNSLNDIEVIYSHSHAINEAKETLSKYNFTNFVPVESTSTAALYASKQKYSAAICSEYAANLYNLKIILRDINDSINITRFIVISKKLIEDGDKTMVMFTVPHKPGALYKVLEKFYNNNINLTMIYSRPLKSIPWQYYFYLEFEGNIKDNKVKATLEEIRNITSMLKIKGSFTKLQYQVSNYLS
ncbi:TPA: prephenate dehydratase [Sulfurisphaera tokodaii]|uniref:Prephenate dehydratase n=1 Tax=Sulfurisphaera tokodaii TaxID=111955 RepID=A0A832WQJ5_9CREN|nr:prephenate dehydratase [Sulfurisphaera tokodaii]